jgi:ectoine hydroxylase
LLTADQLAAYRSDGYLLLEKFFTFDEVDVLGSEFERLVRTKSEATIYEAGTGVVRGHHGAHLVNDVFSDLVRLERFLDAAEAVLDSRVYVHQFKINAKRALVGELWEWHQDFQFWRAEDGMPRPRAVNFAIFLDEVTEFNGPLMFVPGSQAEGLVPVDERPGTWKDTLASALRYQVSVSDLAEATRGRELVAPKGARGTVLMFDCTLLHASAPNMSAHDRRMAIVSYNSVDNALVPVANPRPEFVAARDFTPLDRVPDDALNRFAAQPAGHRS